MEKSICNFYQRNFSVIRRLHFPSVLSAPAYVPPTETPSGFGCHCLSSDSSLSFKYIYMTCLLPHWILCLSFCKCLFPVSNCQCFRPHAKTCCCCNTAAIPPHYTAARKNQCQAFKTFLTVYILWTTFLHYHTVFTWKKLALFSSFRIPFCIIRNKWFS